MKKKFARTLLVMLGCLVALTSVACGPGGGRKGNGNELTIWIQPINQPEYFKGWFKKSFEDKYPEIELNFVPQQSSLLGSTSLDVALTKDTPDMVATWGATVLPQLVRGNRLVDLTDVMPADDKMMDLALMNKVEGKHYGAPIFGFATPVVYYNKDIFAANGWTAPETYEELLTLCANIRKVKDANNRQKYQPITTNSAEHIMTALHGKTMTNEQLAACTADWTADNVPIDNEGFYNGFYWAQDMLAKNVFENNISGVGSEATSNFTLQKSLMYATQSLELFDLSYNCTFEIGSFVLPDPPAKWSSGENAGKVSGIYTDILAINSNSKHIEDCKKVIEFLYTTEAQEQLFNFFLYPTMKDVSYANVNATVKHTFDNCFKPVYDKAMTNGMTVYYSEYFHTSLPANLKSCFNAISSLPTVDKARTETKKIIDSYKK